MKDVIKRDENMCYHFLRVEIDFEKRCLRHERTVHLPPPAQIRPWETRKPSPPYIADTSYWDPVLLKAPRSHHLVQNVGNNLETQKMHQPHTHPHSFSPVHAPSSPCPSSSFLGSSGCGKTTFVWQILQRGLIKPIPNIMWCYSERQPLSDPMIVSYALCDILWKAFLSINRPRMIYFRCPEQKHDCCSWRMSEAKDDKRLNCWH